MKKIYLILILFFVYSCEAVFEDDLSNDVVTILAPTENSQINAGHITFSWQTLEEATSYEVQIATPNFENASQILLDSITDANNLIDSLGVGAYQWRIKAINSAYETPYRIVNFTVN